MMRNGLLWWLAVAWLVMPIVGCVDVVDPNTGQHISMIDPNIAEPVEHGAEAVASLLPFLWPPAGVALAAALAYWRRIKPALVAVRSTAKTTVTAIERLKTQSPPAWADLKPILQGLLPKGDPQADKIRAMIDDLGASSSC